MSGAGVKRAIDAEGIEHADAASANEDVPEVKRLVVVRIELDDLHRFDGVRAIEQQQRSR